VHAGDRSLGDRSLAAIGTDHCKGSDTRRNSRKQNSDDEEATQPHGTVATRRREEPGTTLRKHVPRCLCDGFVRWVCKVLIK
jgi:hypothetical protein